MTEPEIDPRALAPAGAVESALDVAEMIEAIALPAPSIDRPG